MFASFAQAGSVRQVLLWLRQERIELPAAVYGAGRRSVVWKLPVYNTVLHILTNPVYAGAYAFGRTETPGAHRGRPQARRAWLSARTARTGRS